MKYFQSSFAMLIAASIGAVTLLTSTSCLGQGWPNRAERSGSYLPESRHFAVSALMRGAYIPKVGGKSGGSSLVLEPGIEWNFSFLKRLGLFGLHEVSRFKYANVRLLTVDHEAGIRFIANDRLSVEAVYLTHRAVVWWVGGQKQYLGGVLDNGAEVGVWIAGEPISRFRLSLHLFGRIFNVYTDKQGVLGHEWRLSLLPKDGHMLMVAMEFFEVWRQDPRSGVDDFTHNTMGHIEWRSKLYKSLGFFLCAMVSLNMLVGEVPMLELKRSMIDEPMGLGTLGVFFEI